MTTSSPASATGWRSSAQAPVLRISARTGRNVHKVLPGARRGRRGVPPTHPDRRAQPGAAGPPGEAPGPPGPHPLRGPGRGRPAHLHAVRDRPGSRPTTSATSRTSCGSASTSGPPRSSCGCGWGGTERMAWCDECDRLVEDDQLDERGGLPDLRHGAHRGATAAHPLDLQGDARRLRHLPRLPRLPGDRLADPPRVSRPGVGPIPPDRFGR